MPFLSFDENRGGGAHVEREPRFVDQNHRPLFPLAHHLDGLMRDQPKAFQVLFGFEIPDEELSDGERSALRRYWQWHRLSSC